MIYLIIFSRENYVRLDIRPLRCIFILEMLSIERFRLIRLIFLLRVRSLFCLQSLEVPAQSSPWPCECCLSAVEVKQDLLRQIKHWEKLGINERES